MTENTNFLNGKNKTMILLFSIFLGHYGVHNFIMGETKKGILRIILVVTSFLFIPFVFNWFIWGYELVKIIKNTYVVDTNSWLPFSK